MPKPRSHQVTVERGSIGGLPKKYGPDHTLVAAARERLKAANERDRLDRYVEGVITNWSRLDDDRRRLIAALLGGAQE